MEIQWGKKTILTGNFNTGDKTSVRHQDRFWTPWLKTTGLIDAHRHLITFRDAPSTHERRKVRIDYMFVSPSLNIKRSGFLPFSKFPGDHRAIWMDLELIDVIGHNPPSLSIAHARRLKLQDPRTVKRYLSSLTTALHEHNIFRQLKFLFAFPRDKWTTQIILKYERISILFRQLMAESEKNAENFTLVITLGLQHLQLLVTKNSIGNSQ